MSGVTGKKITLAIFAFLGMALITPKVLGFTFNSLCTPEACLNGSIGQLSTGVVLNNSVTSTLLTPGNYSRFRDTASVRANPGFTIDQQAGLVVTQLSPMIVYPRPLYQDEPQLLGEQLDNPKAHVASFLLGKGFQASFGRNGAVLLTAHDSCPNVKQWSIKSLELMSVEPNNCPGGCGSGGSCNRSTSTCECKTGYTGPRCDSCGSGYFGIDCQRCPSCDKSPESTCDDGTTGTGTCISLNPNLNKAQKLFSISENNCNCLNGVCTGTTSCLCSSGWTTSSSNGTLCAECMAGFFLDSRGECVACGPACESCTGPSGICQSCVQGFELSKNDSKTCVPSTINLNGAAPTSCSDGFFNSQNSTCAQCDPACKNCFGASANSCTQCASPKALLSAGHIGNDTLSLGATCVDVDSNTGVCFSPPGSLFLFNQSKGICDPAPHLCSAATIPGFSLLHPQSASSRGTVCSACVEGALLLPDQPGGSGGECVGICPSGTYDDLHGHCTACPAGCSTCNLSGDGHHPQCITCAHPNMLLNSGACTETCPAGTFPSVTANDTPQAPKGVNICLPCSASCGNCTQSPTACQSCPKTRPAFDPGTQTCAMACPKGKFVDLNAGGRCSPCEASCETCSGIGPHDCLSCRMGDILQEGKCHVSVCANNTTQIVADWGVCLQDLFAANSEIGSKGIPSWLIVLVAVLLSVTFSATCLLSWRLWQRKKRQKKTKQFGSELATSDIKLHQLDGPVGQELNQPGWSDETTSMALNYRLSARTPTPSEFKIKRKVVPTDDRMYDLERESMSIYSRSEQQNRVSQPGSLTELPINSLDTESSKSIREQGRTVPGSVWFEDGMHRQPSQHFGPQLASHPSIGSFKSPKLQYQHSK
ncbi:hypothetical protein PGT21_005687 [Puccinia graminis f. sp. tritici]|uniref:EGF-like domain-containing protein n=1 Tax=Puccinia graminis f. sp. tritici TaxID=56615 RepID=A0A5B0M5U0_PUCGR|nr:hypothetical protein PGT21_005687 [Puccinia graminis f. sp. tritici]KAA1123145.1 hypothetical protein PGTUg99_015505 [Puccinia graminis f. sp. tritici]